MNFASSMSFDDAEKFARENGLVKVNQVRGFRTYLAQCWQTRHFVLQFAIARIIASTSQNRLGLFWEFLNPLLTAAMYYVAFGLLLGTRSDSENFIFFLIAGVLTFSLFNQGFNGAAKALISDKELARNLRFPLVLIPISSAIQALLRSLPTLSLIYPVAIFTGVELSWFWLLLPFNMMLTVLFGAGLGLLLTRSMAKIRDFSQALPNFTRVLMFTSGIFFDVTIRFESAPEPIRSIATNSPIALLLDVTRGLFIPSDMPSQNQILWLVFSTFALVFIGFFLFWRGERRDG
jgi:teichoic acid transport system permease protein